MALDKSANLHALTRTSDSIRLVGQSNILWRVLVKAYDRSASKQLQLAMDQPRLDEDTFCQSIRILTASAQGRRVRTGWGRKPLYTVWASFLKSSVGGLRELAFGVALGDLC